MVNSAFGSADKNVGVKIKSAKSPTALPAPILGTIRMQRMRGCLNFDPEEATSGERRNGPPGKPHLLLY